MKKTKRCLALLIAMVMTAMVCIGNGPVTAFADETETAEGSVTEENGSGTTESENEIQAEEPENVEEKNDELSENGKAAEIQAADSDETDNGESDPDAAAPRQEDISTMSLLPLKEVYASVILNKADSSELESVKVKEILSNLMADDGTKIDIDPQQEFWVYGLSQKDGVLLDDYEKVNINDEIDISEFANVKDRPLEIIAGSDGQANPDNVRYIISVYNNYIEEFEFEIYSQSSDNSSREKIEPERVQLYQSDSNLTDNSGKKIPAWNYAYQVKEGEYLQPYLGMSSALDERPDVSIEIYEYDDYVSNEETATPVTDIILNPDMDQIGAGYKMQSEGASFIVLYYINGVQADVVVLNILMTGRGSEVKGTLYKENGESEDTVVDYVNHSFDIQGDIDESFEYVLKNDYSADEEYFLRLDIISGITGENINDSIVKAVAGTYDSLEEATEENDIKGQLFGTGYKANYSGEGLDFTIFFDDTTNWGASNAYKINVSAIDNPDADVEFTEQPVIGVSDPWFRVTGANDNKGNAYDTYVIENGKNINIDTMYGYGYQTVFINEDTDSFVPTFWKADDEAISIDRIYANGREFKEGSELSFPEGENTLDATFSVIITDKNGSHTKNYDVTFVKKASGPQLYVAGPLAPDVRSVFLDEYHEYKHDIFIANIGDEPLTDLWLDLDATNVELDDYWTIGGEGNNTLEACPDDFAEELDSTDYGELSNVAKIRLVPPTTGKGEIEGTLKIYSGKEGDAANSELLATIILSDMAQNPEIETTEVDDAVKYVPYSYLITTDNMYDWVNVSYELTSGSLPEGVELIEETGELYGVPQETGSFTFTVSTYFESTSENYAFDPSEVELTLTVNDNTDDNVFNATDASDNYSILDAIGTEATPGDHHYILEDYSDGQMFRSEGEFDQFVDVWLNGEKLKRGVDYTAEEGSTRITISAQTFENKANKNGERNTIAAEYRTKDPNSKNDSENDNELKKTSQNFYIHKHSYSGTVTTEPTCTETGVKTYTCSCGSKYTETLPALGHTAGEGEITQKLTCTQDEVVSYYCIRCGELMKTKVTPATGHDYEITVTPGKDCSTEGTRTGVCWKCGDTYTEKIPAAGHKYVAEVTTEPTETEDGLRTYTCSVCGDTFTEVIPALGDGTHLHTYDEGVVTKEATCLENGMMTYTCTQCGAVKQETILASGHKFTEEIIKKAACMEPGLKKLTCEYCGAAYTERIPATGHKYDDGIVSKEPTETETGVRTYTCTVCGNSYTEVIPMLNSDLAREESGNTENINSANADEKSDSVKTGDKTSVAFWMCMMGMASAAAAIGMTMRRRKK